jgi:hypothetical protein
MNKVRQRKMNARAHRQECLHTTENIETIIQIPNSKNKIKNVEIKAENRTNTVVTETIKRGRGRPPKEVSEKIEKKNTGNFKAKKLVSAKGKK